jgi:hypothetical protein
MYLVDVSNGANSQAFVRSTNTSFTSGPCALNNNSANYTQAFTYHSYPGIDEGPMSTYERFNIGQYSGLCNGNPQCDNQLSITEGSWGGGDLAVMNTTNISGIVFSGYMSIATYNSSGVRVKDYYDYQLADTPDDGWSQIYINNPLTTVVLKKGIAFTNFTRTHSNGSSVYQNRSNSTDLLALATGNRVWYNLSILNNQPTTTHTAYITLYNITNLTNLTEISNSTTYTCTENNTCNLGDISPFTYRQFSVNTASISTTNTTPTQNTTVTEGTSTTFSITLYNPRTETVLYDWSLNGTNVTSCYNLNSCVVTASSTSSGNYNLSVQTLGAANRPNYSWNLTITDNPNIGTTDAQTACYQAALGIQSAADFLRIFLVAVTGIFLAGIAYKAFVTHEGVDLQFFITIAIVAVTAGFIIGVGAVLVGAASATC